MSLVRSWTAVVVVVGVAEAKEKVGSCSCLSACGAGAAVSIVAGGAAVAKEKPCCCVATEAVGVVEEKGEEMAGLCGADAAAGEASGVASVVVAVANEKAGSFDVAACAGDIGFRLPPPKIDFGFGLKGLFSHVVAGSGLAIGVCPPPNTECGLARNGVPELSLSMFATGFGGRKPCRPVPCSAVM